MSSENAIIVDNISKHYLIYDRPEDRLRQMIMPRVRRIAGMKNKQYFTQFSANRNLSFKIKKGQSVGIIGRNGSGKSTLLQMICGTLTPSEGSINVKGRIAALLELGSGFNPEFTGRENIYLNASILGLTRKETDERFDSILEFANIGIFIDQPVKTYSSGMFVRLAFAVATSVDPDLLIVDEALAVGDESFQRKCFARIEQIKERGGTILFVSHSAQTIVQLCDRAILLDGGELLLDNEPKMVIGHYQRLVNAPAGKVSEIRQEIVKLGNDAEHNTHSETAENHQEETEGTTGSSINSTSPGHFYDPDLKSDCAIHFTSDGAEIRNIVIKTQSGEQVNNLCLGEEYTFSYTVDIQRDFRQTAFAMFIKALNGTELAGLKSHSHANGNDFKAGETISVEFPFVCNFTPDTYACNCGTYSYENGEFKQLDRKIDVLLFKVLPNELSQQKMGFFDIMPINSSPKFKSV